MKKPLNIGFESNAMCIAPAGSGKGINTVIPNILSIRDSKVSVDFKGENSSVTKAALEARGEKVIILNPPGLWSDSIGQGETYNVLDLIVEDLYRPGGIQEVMDDVRELCAQLLPEPNGKSSSDTFWREGSRRIIAIAILIEIMVEEYDANLSRVAQLIEDRNLLEDNFRWLLGIDLEGKPLATGVMPIERTPWAQHHNDRDVDEFASYIRAQASNWLAMMSGNDSKTFDSFISGAQQSLTPFAFGKIATSMKQSSFSMNELKDSPQPVSLFIVADSSRMEVYKRYLGLIQWAALTVMKRHPNKKKPVYFIMDEATNFTIHGLESLLTWGRGTGIRLLLIFQDLSAFERVYGKETLDTLLSETEIKIFLPGNRSPKTLKIISEMLGQQSVMAASLSQNSHGLHENMSETGRSLMNPDEIRRCHYGILFVRQLPPILVEPVSYAEIHPFRLMASINPFHGKPFLQKVKLKLGGIWKKSS